MNRIGIYFAYWEKEWEGDYKKYVSKVKNLGFDTLEVAVASVADMSVSKRQSLSACAEDNGIDLSYCIGLPACYDVASADDGVRKSGTAYVKSLLGVIKEMKGDMLGGIIYSAWPATVGSYDEKMRARERSLRSMREILKCAEDYGITCCFEVVNRFEQYIMNCVEEGIEYVKETESDNAGLLLDTFHMNIEEDDIPSAIRAARGYIRHFHMGECNRKPPNESGKMPWTEIGKALKDTGYDGRMVMEPFVQPGGQVGGDIRIFRNIIDDTREENLDLLAKRSCAFIKSVMK